MERYTDAPEVYDYGYVATLSVVGKTTVGMNAGSAIRRLRASDPDRFERYQSQRYASGGYSTWTYDELADAAELGLVELDPPCYDCGDETDAETDDAGLYRLCCLCRAAAEEEGRRLEGLL